MTFTEFKDYVLSHTPFLEAEFSKDTYEIPYFKDYTTALTLRVVPANNSTSFSTQKNTLVRVGDEITFLTGTTRTNTEYTISAIDNTNAGYTGITVSSGITTTGLTTSSKIQKRDSSDFDEQAFTNPRYFLLNSIKNEVLRVYNDRIPRIVNSETELNSSSYRLYKSPFDVVRDYYFDDKDIGYLYVYSTKWTIDNIDTSDGYQEIFLPMLVAITNIIMSNDRISNSVVPNDFEFEGENLADKGKEELEALKVRATDFFYSGQY